jgi:UDP-glucose-4-epimerase GalE
MMKVLVTGGAGYIGSHTAKELVRDGHEVVVLDNFSTGHRWAVQWGELVEGDTGDIALVARTLRRYGIDAVMHFAASTYVGESMADPRKYFRNNVVNTLGLLDGMLAAGVTRMVFSSTAATYGIPEQLPMTEEHPQKPVNPYGESKLFIEKMLGWYAPAYGLTYAALRYFNAAGADPDCQLGEKHFPETHLIPLVIEAVLGRRGTIDIYGTDYPTPDGTAIRDYIHVTDLARAHVLALRQLEAGNSVLLNLGTGRGYSVREVIRVVQTVTGRTVPTSETPRRLGDPAVLVAAAGRAAEVLGWQPRYSELGEIVRTAFDWHAAQNELRPMAKG